MCEGEDVFERDAPAVDEAGATGICSLHPIALLRPAPRRAVIWSPKSTHM